MDIARRRAEERARARDPQTWGVDKASLTLPANADVQAVTDLRGAVARARRQDVFDLFSARGSLSRPALEAVRRLQDDMAVLHRQIGGTGEITPKVDRSRSPASFSDARLRAGERIEAVMGLTGAASARLLGALCEAEAVMGRVPDWRATVEQATGERLPDAHGAILRAACENLAGAFAVVDRKGRR